MEKVDTTIFPSRVGDVILVNDKMMYKDYSMDEAYGYGKILGYSVVSVSGGYQGRVRDIIFGARTGKIHRIRFDYTGSQLVPVSFVTVKAVEIQDVVSIESGRLYIKDPAYAFTEREGSLDGAIKFLANTIDDPDGTLDYETRYRLWEQEWGEQYRTYYGRDPYDPNFPVQRRGKDIKALPKKARPSEKALGSEGGERADPGIPVNPGNPGTRRPPLA
eukprot:CAMPEP_0167775508 /NCGR_PEP_ID=MMETSP0111_2-20121227/2604_1 /TAXON_ID=91324 /ORGANISM="Lotharella globosa, Strain CCCM811" /LENGTH=217 /DNA_ID=CAMNT_0007665443 /DNA_START=51 /DNA_END=702 /DNA_ORIENTATION=-